MNRLRQFWNYVTKVFTLPSLLAAIGGRDVAVHQESSGAEMDVGVRALRIGGQGRTGEIEGQRHGSVAPGSGSDKRAPLPALAER